MLGSGLSPHRLEWQLIARARPGIVDTSALPMDFVSNPGTMNAIINFARRPLFEERVLKWRKAAACAADADPAACWCEPGRDGQVLGAQPPDRAGAAHPQGRRGLRSATRRRSSASTSTSAPAPSSAGSTTCPTCARPIPNSATTARPRSTSASAAATAAPSAPSRTGSATSRRSSSARAPPTSGRRAASASPRDLEVALEAEFGAGDREGQHDGSSSAGGRSSPRTAPAAIRARRSSPGPPTSPRPTRATRRCASTGSATTRWRPPPRSAPTRPARCTRTTCRAGSGRSTPRSTRTSGRPTRCCPEVMKGGGRGYYRNVSLLSVWAHAPFMHNNAIGPEICGKPAQPALDFYASPYVDAEGRPLADAPDCWPFDPSVEGRYELYKASMQRAAEPRPADPEGVRARPRHRHRHRAEGRDPRPRASASR